MGSHLFKEALNRTQVSPLTYPKAQALRDYDTLSVNSVTAIPIGARLIGNMGKLHQGNTPIPIIKTVARVIFELFFPVVEIYVNILRAFPGTSAELSSLFYGSALTFTSDGSGSKVSVPEALRDLKQRGLGGELAPSLRELNQHRRRRRAEMKALIQRIFMGLFGGIALICPVLIMALVPSQNTNLITVSIATILFAIILAIGATDSTGKDILAATAAYTAVLVVFFGTSSS